MKTKRGIGTLLHISSLPSKDGIGDFGVKSYEFVDFLKESGQTYWQILPTGVTGHGYSPYQSISAFAGNPLFINIDSVIQMGLLSKNDLINIPAFESKTVDYYKVEKYKMPLLRKAFENFKKQDEIKKWDLYKFNDSNNYWLDDYALFKALKDYFNNLPWSEWPEDIKLYKATSVEYWRAVLGDDVYFNKFVQYLYFVQFKELKKYANDNGIQIVGDIPIFVSYDSADVWSKPHFFYLDDNLKPYVIAGVPPDYFSKTGQRWGNPLYKWEKMKEDDYLWWRLRFELLLEQSDMIRLDHFRGFEAYWEIPAESETAINGKWVKGPGHHFFDVLRKYFGHLPIIAEDLGVITDEVEDLRDKNNFPGMKILQFAFGDTSENPFLPHNHCVNSIVYTGTHDNDTLMGWYKKLVETNDKTLKVVSKYVSTDLGMPWDLIKASFASVSRIAIIPMQDYLELDNSARMNIPGTTEGNWSWKMESIPKDLAAKIKNLAILYNRTEIEKD